MDIKAPLAQYDAITATPGSGTRAFEALGALLASGVAYECRTTWHAQLFGVAQLLDLADALRAQGVRHRALQECRAPGAPAWSLTPEDVAQLGAGFATFTLRRA